MSCLLAGRDVASFLKEQVCDFLTTGKNNIKPVIYDSVRTRARTLPAAAQGERIGPSPPFLFPAGLDRLLVVADPSCLASGGWSHSRTPEQVEYASPGRAQGGAGTDRGCFLAIHPLPPPSWLCISTARTSSRSSSPQARRQGSTDSTRIPCTSVRNLQSPAAMPDIVNTLTSITAITPPRCRIRARVVVRGRPRRENPRPQRAAGAPRRAGHLPPCRGLSRSASKWWVHRRSGSRPFAAVFGATYSS